MIVRSAIVTDTKQTVSVIARVNNQVLEFSVTLTNGKVLGTCNDNISTSSLDYLYRPQIEREKDFDLIKEYIEKHIAG